MYLVHFRSKVQAAKPQNIAEIKMKIIKACNDIPQDTLQVAMAQFPKRLQHCIESGGHRFEYHM